MTLRRRFSRYLTLTAIVSSLLAFAVAAVLVRHRVAVQRHGTLVKQAEIAAAADLAPGSRVYRVGNGAPKLLANRRAAARVLAAIPASDTADGALRIGQRTLDYVARPSALGRVVVIGPVGTTFAEFRPFLISLVIAGAGGALLAALLAIALARHLSRPVADLAAATKRLAAGESGVTVPADGDDELADLGRSFNEMSSELSRARAGQRRFLESVSHELRTPLTSIRGYAEALEEGAVTPEQGAGVIAAEAGRLERLVADLLELARLGRDGFTVQCAPVDLSAVAGRALERHAPKAAALGIGLSGQGSEPAPGWGDADRLLQVLSNLIENALRLTPAGGNVSVRYRPSELAVLDTGPGLAPEDLPRAFERFYLHERYRSERPVGSGLGLAIVEELVRAMGGSVEARPRQGGPGAEFVVRLATRERSATPDAGRPSA